MIGRPKPRRLDVSQLSFNLFAAPFCFHALVKSFVCVHKGGEVYSVLLLGLGKGLKFIGCFVTEVLPQQRVLRKAPRSLAADKGFVAKCQQ